MKKTEIVSETSVFNLTLMQLIARNNFITFICHEGFKFYVLF
jgi:hypothetical protein